MTWNITELQTESIAILKALVGFDTTSSLSNLNLIAWVEEYLLRHGVGSERVNACGDKSCLIATIGDSDAKGGVILSGHSDVVPTEDQIWQGNPYALAEREGRLYGRGTADMKAFIAITLACVPQWQRMKPSKPIRICITHDEEIGCLSAAPVAEFLREAGITPELMVIGEPTSMRVVNAHKGILSYETVVTGLEAHSSATHRGVNAVMVAAELVHLLSKEAERAREQGVQDARFDPPYTTVHVGVLEGGVARNIIPASCRMAWEIRPVPGDTPQDILARFESHALALQAEMRTRYAGASIVIRQLTNVAPLKPHDEGGEQLVKRLLGTNEAHAVSFGTEAGIFQSYGLPAIVCGPGSIDQAHKPDEYIEISQISACLRFLEQLTASLSS